MTNLSVNKTYAYWHPDPSGIYLQMKITSKEIIHCYWVYWKTMMQAKNKKPEDITKENCILDWVISNWAIEIN